MLETAATEDAFPSGDVSFFEKMICQNVFFTGKTWEQTFLTSKPGSHRFRELVGNIPQQLPA